MAARADDIGLEDIALFDADNHYYEAADAFTRHLPADMRARCVQWVEIDGRRHHLVGGRLDRQVHNPTFDPVSAPGVLREYFRGNPRQLSTAELLRSSVEPRRPEYTDRDARLARMDQQGVAAAWLFPTLGVLYEERLKRDVPAVGTTFTAFNRWLAEDWGLDFEHRIFAAPVISLIDVDWACAELEWALDGGARVVVMRPAAVFTAAGPRSPADACFDEFWARVDEAGITVAVHLANSGYSTNGYPRGGTFETIGGGARPSVVSLNPDRAILDFLLTLVYDRLFERFDNLRVASIENGSAFLPELFRALDTSRRRLGGYYADDPVDVFRRHVWINPFWEDDTAEVIEAMGADRVIFGSDWPHVEGLPEPADVFAELDGVSDADRRLVLHDNTADLNELRPR